MNITTRFHHYAVVVDDLDLMKNWYSEKLGFRVERQFDLEEAGLTIAYMIAPGGFRLEFLCPAPPHPASTGEDDRWMRAGSTHICFLVDDIEAAAVTLRNHSIPLIQEVKTIEAAGVLNCWIQDPEGNPIEFIEPIQN